MADYQNLRLARPLCKRSYASYKGGETVASTSFDIQVNSISRSWSARGQLDQL